MTTTPRLPAMTRQPGDVVPIFYDFLTCGEHEGDARLVELEDDTPAQVIVDGQAALVERWRVRFLADGFETSRCILNR